MWILLLFISPILNLNLPLRQFSLGAYLLLKTAVSYNTEKWDEEEENNNNNNSPSFCSSSFIFSLDLVYYSALPEKRKKNLPKSFSQATSA